MKSKMNATEEVLSCDVVYYAIQGGYNFGVGE